jgi:hypothetical protein
MVRLAPKQKGVNMAKFLRIDMTWQYACQVFLGVLQHGSTNGRGSAIAGIQGMADRLHDLLDHPRPSGEGHTLPEYRLVALSEDEATCLMQDLEGLEAEIIEWKQKNSTKYDSNQYAVMANRYKRLQRLRMRISAAFNDYTPRKQIEEYPCPVATEKTKEETGVS